MDKYEILQWFPVFLGVVTIIVNVVIFTIFKKEPEINNKLESDNFEGIFGLCCISTIISTIITVLTMLLINIFL